ncbi:hypothetical protein Tco_1260626, partial [Tanacetum coccineum]
YGYIKNHKKTVKNGQTRIQERKSVQEPEAKVRKVNPQSTLVKKSKSTLEDKDSKVTKQSLNYKKGRESSFHYSPSPTINPRSQTRGFSQLKGEIDNSRIKEQEGMVKNVTSRPPTGQEKQGMTRG